MNQEIATATFFILLVVTMFFQFVMYYRRNKFLRAVKGQPGKLINYKGSRIDELGTMLQVVVPVKLSAAGRQYEELRNAAVKASYYWILSLLLTLILPIILFYLTK